MGTLFGMFIGSAVIGSGLTIGIFITVASFIYIKELFERITLPITQSDEEEAK